MKCYIESRPVCPFVGKECIGCGVTQQSIRDGILRTCMFFDQYYASETEPCLLKRAVNRILKIPDYPTVDNTSVDVPW